MELKYLLKNGDESEVELPSQAFLEEEARQQYLHDYNTDIKYAEIKGEIKGEIKSILRILKKRFPMMIPQQSEEIIREITDLEQLGKLTDYAFDCESIEEFRKALK